MATMFKTALILLAVATSIAAAAQTSDNVLLIVNEASPVSLEVGQYYSQRRSIAKNQILRVKACLQESIARADYESQIQAPIASWLARESAHDGILYIVLTKGAPPYALT